MNMERRVPRHISIDSRLRLEDALEIVDGTARLELSSTARKRCAEAFGRLEIVIAENRHVYGVTTGFGPLANRLVDGSDGERLQQNLVYHLASGVGEAFDWRTARAVVLSRVMALVQGASGARPETIDCLVALLNSDLAPRIPARGTVGASGDLTPLAHVVLCFQGKAPFLDRDGTVIEGLAALARLGIEPLDLSHRDGLALVNGTSAMTGVALLNAVRIDAALDLSCRLTGAMAEALGGRTEAWNEAFAELRPHAGQVWAIRCLQSAVRGSSLVNPELLAHTKLEFGKVNPAREHAGQDAYTLRCAPQVIGAVRDTAIWHRQVVETEFHSVTDNPVFPETTDALALHGGNFMGVHLALASDAAAQAATVIAGFHERQIARITDERLNNGLPAFLSGGPIGLTSGLMGAQVTATALVAEMRATGPASIHSISTNGANQDVVSQGTIAARALADKLDHLFRIQAILAICVVQALELRERSGRTGEMSPSTFGLRQVVRDVSAFLDEDRPLGEEIDRLAAALAVMGSTSSTAP